MANTGIEIVLTLKQVAAPCPPPYTGCTPAPGNPTKPNVEGDPDYIAPYQNLTNCPITYDDTCPEVIYTPTSNSIMYEFSLENSVVNNPNIKKILITLTNTTTSSSVTKTFVLPNTPSPNFFIDTFTGLSGATNYDFVVSYLNASDTTVKTCPTINILTT